MKRKLLAPQKHAVFQLAPDLLLVFKPRGHREEAHATRIASGYASSAASSWYARRGSRRYCAPAARRSPWLPGERMRRSRCATTWLVAERYPVRTRQGNFP